jgi:glutamate carboxypeptidase
VFTPDEETGGAESLPVVAEICGGTRGVILPEPSCPDGSLKARRKGVAAIEAILSGLAAHSGIEPEKGRDANRALGHLIREIDHGIAEIGEVTFNPGIISGGVRTNVVAPRSRLEGELRSFSNRKLASALDWLAGLRDIGGVEVTMTTRLVHPALEADEKNSRLADIARAVADSLGQPLKCGSSGGASDGSTLSARGIPVVDGLGMRGGGAHAKEEFIEMNDFPFRAALITGLCMEI